MRAETILILADESDEHATHMFHHLRQKQQDVEFLNSRWFPQQLTLSLHIPAGRSVIGLPSGRRLEFSEIKSVYWRGYEGIGAADLADQEQAWIAHNDSRGLFESFLILLPARWVNGWEAYWLHQTKPVQLSRVAALGVRIPSTLLTNDSSALVDFAASRPPCIVKPVQGGDHAARLQPAHLAAENLAQLRLAPITVQTEVPGTNIRAFVAGESVLACEVRTSELDYREDSQPELLVHDLPPPLADTCRRIARELQLLWTGIDFRLTPEGEYVFLEANPSPMFLGFEKYTGLPLTERLAALLIDA
jgi:glutathione synthase/RimK-type ligase-like ATP-grasp enzyme